MLGRRWRGLSVSVVLSDGRAAGAVRFVRRARIPTSRDGFHARVTTLHHEVCCGVIRRGRVAGVGRRGAVHVRTSQHTRMVWWWVAGMGGHGGPIHARGESAALRGMKGWRMSRMWPMHPRGVTPE